MRVSFLSPRLPPASCGVGDHTANLARAVAELSVRVAFIYRHGNTVAQDLLDGPLAHWKGTGPSLLECVSEQSPDWLWVQLSGYGYSRSGAPFRLGSALARLRRNMPDVRLAVCVHETHCQPFQLGKKGPLLSPWQRYTIGRVARLADVVLPTIQPWQERVIKEYGVPSNKVSLLPIGSNIPPIHLTAADREQRRRKLGWPDDETVAVIFGSYPSQLLALARFETLLVQGIQEGYLDRIVCMGGEGSAQVQGLDASCWAQRLGSGRDQFQVLGPRPAREVGQILACCDLALAPTPRPLLGKSGAFMAFAAAGLPVIVHEDSPTVACDEWPVFSALKWQWGLLRSETMRESGRALQMRYQKCCDWPVIAQRAVTFLSKTTVRSDSQTRRLTEVASSPSSAV